MPLTLSSGCSATSTSSAASPPPPEEVMGQAVDGYFAEILAADLEQSSSIFALRRMTSGSPDPALSSEDKFSNVAGHPGWPNRFPVTPSFHSSLSPGRALGPIKEKMPVVSFLGNRNTQKRQQQEDGTDAESVAGTEVSKGAGARSNASRDRSIFTVATSLTSSWISNLKHASPPTSEPDRERSWIDPDTEDDEPENASQEMLGALSPRPQTPRERQRIHASQAVEVTNGTAPSTARPKQHHKKSHSISAFASSGRQPRQNSTRSHRGRRSRSPPPPISDDEAPPIPVRRRPRASTFQTTDGKTYQELASRRQAVVLMDQPQYEDFTLADHMSQQEIPDLAVYGSSPPDEPDNIRQNQDFVRPPPPSSPLPTVESWLNTNAHTYATHPNDEVFKAVPLSPNVMETLRISVTCFPETMLLTSSLTVETIRSYSKKVRQPTTDVQTTLSNLPLFPSAQGYPRKSLWRKVASYTKHTSSSDAPRRLQFGSGPGAGPRGLRAPAEEAETQPQPWEHLRNIFTGASDYICDALWAHIIAYNYISAHVPRQRVPDLSHESSSKDEIPKKAASLLGLASATAQDVQRSVNKLSGPLAGLLQRQDMVVEPPAGRRAAAQEAAMRDLQAGLMRCIARLIATAKFMVDDGRHDGPVMDVDVTEQGADLFLARSLCEIVRFSEDETA